MTLANVSIRGKLLTLAILTSAAALVLSGVVLLGASYLIMLGNDLRDIVGQASIVSANTSAAVDFDDAPAATETLDTLRALPTVDVACVYDPKGSLLARYSPPSSTSGCPQLPPQIGRVAGITGIAVAESVHVKDGTRTGTVYIHANVSDIVKQLKNESWAILGAFVVGGLGALLIALRLQRVISGPLLALSDTAAEISKGGDYSLRATREGRDEIGELVGTFNDMVSQVERREEDLRAANRLKDEFLATLSHELRTPLNAIVGWLQLLRLSPGDPAMRERALASLDRNAKIQTRLIEDLLDVSSIASGKLRLTFESVDLADVLSAALEVVRPTAGAKKISIEAPATKTGVFVIGDGARLEQVIWNLLSNAIKFTPPGGHIRVSLETVEAEHVIRVRDDGAGITPDFLPQVFDRFRQADGSMTRRQGGLGVGLAIARELTERHGGRVTAESEGAGRGSTFSVFLPAARPQSAGGQPVLSRADARLTLFGLSVLVVDDDAEAREMARSALMSAGAHVETADGAESALAVLADRWFDALVCDIAMPQVDGFDLVGVLRRRPEHRINRTAAVALTAHADDDSRARALNAGFQAVVVKPFDFATLIGAVRSVARPAQPPPALSSQAQAAAQPASPV